MTTIDNAYFGNDGSGDFGGKIARPGVDVFAAGPLDLLFSTDQPIMGLAEEGSFTVAANPSGSAVGTYMFAQDFGYIPFVLVSCFSGPLTSTFGVYSRFAWFGAIFPGPVFTQVSGFVTNVESDRLLIRNIYSDAAQSFGVSVFWRRTD
jgi:hypothetical protein